MSEFSPLIIFSRLDWLVVCLAFAILLASVVARSFMANNSVLNYISIGRQLTLPMFVVIMVASWYGMVFGVTQISFKNGIYNFVTQGVFWYIAAALFAFFIAGRVNQSKMLTIPQMIGNAYGNRPRVTAAALFVISTLPMQYAIGFGSLLNLILGLDLYVSSAFCLLVIGFFTYFGGMRGTVVTDVIQFFLMFFAVGSVLVCSIYKFGGLEYLQSALPESYFKISGEHNTLTLLSWFLIAISTTFLSPVFYSRAAMAKSPQIAKRGVLIAILFWIVCDICTTFGGMYAKAFMPDAKSNLAYMEYGIAILPEGLRGLFVVGLVATAFSALDTFFFIPVMIIMNDLMPKKISFAWSRVVAIFLVIVLSLLFAIYSHYYIEYARLVSEGLFVGMILMPLICSLLFKGLNRKVFWYAVGFSSLAQIYGAVSFGLENIALYGIVVGGIVVICHVAASKIAKI